MERTSIARSTQFLRQMSEFVPCSASSNVRARNEIAVARGQGGELFDLDGNRYVDYILGFGPAILGHGHPAVSCAVSEAVKHGTTFAFTNESEYRLCKLITEICPSVEMVRLCNSGTDAGVTAYRIARVITGRAIAVKIQGDYNGGFDLLAHDVPGVDGAALNRGPVAVGPGFFPEAHNYIRTVPINALRARAAVFEQNHDQIAAVFMEPILGNVCAIMPQPGYLEEVRKLCTVQGALLVLDEVKTGFRVALGGAQSIFKVHADLTMFGKALGNGFPIAAIGGKRKFMEVLTPGKAFHCGTYYGNLACSAAAEATLKELARLDYAQLNDRGRRLALGICSALHEAGLEAGCNGPGALFGVYMGSRAPTDYRSWWVETDRKGWDQIGKLMRNLGVLHDEFIGLFFMSFAHTQAHVDETLAACRAAIRGFQGSGKAC